MRGGSSDRSRARDAAFLGLECRRQARLFDGARAGRGVHLSAAAVGDAAANGGVLVIYLVAMVAPSTEETPRLIAELQRVSDGWVRLDDQSWIVFSELDANALRDCVGAVAAAALVLHLSGGWASKGFEDAAGWLKQARGRF